MKLFIITTLTLSTLAFASGDKFEIKKTRRLEMINKTIASLTKTKSCIQAAKDKAALKECGKERKVMRDAMKAKRDEMKAKRKAMKSQKSE